MIKEVHDRVNTVDSIRTPLNAVLSKSSIEDRSTAAKEQLQVIIAQGDPMLACHALLFSMYRFNRDLQGTVEARLGSIGSSWPEKQLRASTECAAWPDKICYYDKNFTLTWMVQMQAGGATVGWRQIHRLKTRST